MYHMRSEMKKNKRGRHDHYDDEDYSDIKQNKTLFQTIDGLPINYNPMKSNENEDQDDV